MVTEMKWAVSLLCFLNLAGAAQLSEGRTVYLLPMSRGLDQFIANRLTRTHLMQVVTDPAKADIIITDRVGEPLENRLNDLYPPPPAAAAPAPPPPKDAKETAEDKPEAHSLGILGDTVNKADKQGSMATGGRSHGTIFLVDVKSRQVLWSVFLPPKNWSPQGLDQAAERIVKRLKEDLEGKVK